MQAQGIKQRTKILKLLSTKGFISGEEIAARCGMSRISVWKHINYLISMGVKIKVHPNKGYEFRGFGFRLLPEIIALHMGKSEVVKDIIYLEEVNSTNEYAKRNFEEGLLIVAEQQKKGKGRLGRRWYSQKYKDLLFSITFSPRIPYTYLGMVNVIGVLSVVRALRTLYKLNAYGKWPNDVLVEGRKICGVLVEFFAQTDVIESLILGIGINVNSRPKLRNTTSVKKLLDEDVDRVTLLIEVIRQLEFYYNNLIYKDFSFLKRAWTKYSGDYSRKVSLLRLGGKLQGISRGIDDCGNLILKQRGREICIPPVDEVRLKVLEKTT